MVRDKNKERARQQRYHQNNRAKILERMRRNALAYKIDVLTHYGNGELACIRCGFHDIRALTIDHLNGGGINHRRIIGNSKLYRYLKKSGFPEGYQTLCMNCQYLKRVKNREYGIRGQS